MVKRVIAMVDCALGRVCATRTSTRAARGRSASRSPRVPSARTGACPSSTASRS